MKRKSKATGTLILVLLLTFLTVISFLVFWNAKVRIGVLITESDEQYIINENSALIKFVQSNHNRKTEVITPDQIIKNPDILKKIDILWIHRIDTSSFRDDEVNPEIISAIRRFLDSKGKLFLTMEAFRYINLLGIEKKLPEIRFVNAIDDGYGRKLGFHSFRGHPVFEELYGGAYVLNPTADKRCRQIGYFGNSLPAEGKVVAVDWAYINLKESSKLILEYNPGKGKVIAVGSYIYLADENRNRKHLELFLNNVFSYFIDPSFGKDRATHWEYGSRDVNKFNHIFPKFYIPESSDWDLSGYTLALKPSRGSSNYCEVAGQRMLIMGNERGGIEELWSHPFMAMRDYEAGIQFNEQDSILWLCSQDPEVEIRPESFIRKYHFSKSTLMEVVTTDIANPSAVIHYEYNGDEPVKVVIRVKTSMRQMWPYSENAFGNIYYTFDEGLNAFIWKDQSDDFVTIFGSNLKPVKHLVGQYQNIIWNGTDFIPVPKDTLLISGLMQFQLKPTDRFDIIIASSNDNINGTITEYKKAIANPEQLYLSTYNYYNSFLKNQLMITTPDDKFNEGYRWALIGTDRFNVNTPGIGESLVAGYSTTLHGWDGGHKVNGRPGYAWYFGRDAVWSAFAVLGYGHFNRVKNILKTFQNYQDPNGKIYHELTTSGFPHYDAADATPLFIALAGRYLKHSGDIAFIEASWENIKRAIDYCYSTDTDGDKLIENTNVGHGWVEGGWLYGSHTTLYLASVWAAALSEAAYMANTLGLKNESILYSMDCKAVESIINHEYWNPLTNHFNYGKLQNNTYNPEVTVMASIPMLFGLVDTSQALPVVQRFARNGFTSDWGVRIVEEDHKLFNPKGYHTGSVWPLYTGWAALAEYQYSFPTQGYTHLMNNLLNYQYFGLGYVDEVLNGSVYQPAGVCNHQCWSETMVLQPAIEGMLGFKPDALNNFIFLSPSFPVNWDSVRVENIRSGTKNLSFSMKRGIGKTTWSFINKGGKQTIFLNALFPAGTEIKNTRINGIKTLPSVNDDSRRVTLGMEAPISNKLIVEIEHEGGIAVVPDVPEPIPFAESKGFRIIDSWISNDAFFIKLQEKSSTSHQLRIYNPGNRITEISNGFLVKDSDGYSIVKVDFEKSEGKYTDKIVRINLRKQ